MIIASMIVYVLPEDTAVHGIEELGTSTDTYLKAVVLPCSHPAV
jgi:hypothetical protein